MKSYAITVGETANFDEVLAEVRRLELTVESVLHECKIICVQSDSFPNIEIDDVSVDENLECSVQTPNRYNRKCGNEF